MTLPVWHRSQTTVVAQTAVRKANFGFGVLISNEHVKAGTITCAGWARDLNVVRAYVPHGLTGVKAVAATVLLDASSGSRTSVAL